MDYCQDQLSEFRKQKIELNKESKALYVLFFPLFFFIHIIHFANHGETELLDVSRWINEIKPKSQKRQVMILVMIPVLIIQILQILRVIRKVILVHYCTFIIHPLSL
jgi:hypothetical protein